MDLGSLNLLLADLRTRGIVTTRRTLKTKVVGGIPFTRGPLAHLLRNRFYIGEVRFKGEILQTAGLRSGSVRGRSGQAYRASQQVAGPGTETDLQDAIAQRTIADITWLLQNRAITQSDVDRVTEAIIWGVLKRSEEIAFGGGQMGRA